MVKGSKKKWWKAVKKTLKGSKNNGEEKLKK